MLIGVCLLPIRSLPKPLFLDLNQIQSEHCFFINCWGSSVARSALVSSMPSAVTSRPASVYDEIVAPIFLVSVLSRTSEMVVRGEAEGLWSNPKSTDVGGCC